MMVPAVSLLLAALAGPPAPADTGLVVRVVRFYRVDTRQTQVAAFIQAPAAAGSGLALRVADSADATLWEQSWQRRAAEGAGEPVDHLRFTVGPGRYVLEVAVLDSAGAVRQSQRVAVRGFPTNPGASDLLLAPQVRPADPADTMPRAQEFRRGSLLITASALVELSPGAPVLHYLLEAYIPEGGEGNLAVQVREPDGSIALAADPAPIQVPRQAGALTGQLDLAALEPGDYLLATLLTIGDQEITRLAPFRITGDPPVSALLAPDSEAGMSDPEFFARIPDQELADALAPLAALPTGRLLNPRDAPRDPGALRAWLVAFWRSRDPDPGRPGNPARDRFYRGVVYANDWYVEPGRGGVPGWRTDRGRILLRNEGPPEQILRQAARGPIRAYEAWRYRAGERYYYVFVDRTGLGVLELVHSNDPRETGRRDWQALLTARGVAEIEGFLGVRLR